jgi:hypothetical protein
MSAPRSTCLGVVIAKTELSMLEKCFKSFFLSEAENFSGIV